MINLFIIGISAKVKHNIQTAQDTLVRVKYTKERNVSGNYYRGSREVFKYKLEEKL